MRRRLKTEHTVFVARSLKVTVVPVHAMKANSGTGGAAPLILNLGATRSSVVNITPRPL